MRWSDTTEIEDSTAMAFWYFSVASLPASNVCASS
jgi:hypothetical protein